MNQTINDRNKYIPWIFIPTIMAILIQTAVSIFLLELYVIKELSTVSGGTYTDFSIALINDFINGDASAIISLLYASIAGIIAFIIFKGRFREGKLSSLKGKSKNVPCTVGGILIFTVGMEYVTLYLMNSVSSAFPSWLEEYEQLMESAGIDAEMTIIMTCYAVIFGPICEEILFRGITFFAARKIMPVQFAILVQAIMFGAFHMNKLQGIYAFVLALGLGYIMYLYDNLLVTICIHILFNFCGTIGSAFMPVGGDNLISFFACSLASLIAVYGSIILLRKGSALVKDDSFFADI